MDSVALPGERGLARGQGRELLGVLPPAGTGALGSLHGASSWERGGESQEKCEGLARSSVQGPGAAKAGRAGRGKAAAGCKGCSKLQRMQGMQELQWIASDAKDVDCKGCSRLCSQLLPSLGPGLPISQLCPAVSAAWLLQRGRDPDVRVLSSGLRVLQGLHLAMLLQSP